MGASIAGATDPDRAAVRPVGFLLGLLVVAAVALPIAPESRVFLLDLAAALVLLHAYRELQADRTVWRLVSLFAVYSGLLLVSTVGHGLSMSNFVRRDYGAVLLVIESLGLYFLLRHSGYWRQVALIAGFSFALCMHFFYPADARMQTEPLKFLVGLPLGVLGGCAISVISRGYVGGRMLVIAFYVAYSVICFLSGARSVGGIFFGSALLLLVRFSVVARRWYGRAFPLYFLAGLLAIYVASEGYAALALAGVFGQRAQGIAQFQEQFFHTLLLGGRPEIVVNLLALYDSPLIGHGAIDQTQKYTDAMSVIGVYSDATLESGEQVLFHSMVFTAGHEAGAFAMIFWAYLLYAQSFATTVVLGLGRRIAPICVPILLHGVWDVLFSPLNPYVRLSTALSVAITVFWINQWRDRWQAVPIENLAA